MRSKRKTQRTSRAAVNPGPPIRTDQKNTKSSFFHSMACLVVDDAKCKTGTGRGAHRARPSIRALPS
eukprot:97647-Pyramimonas_sp.AAC.1